MIDLFDLAPLDEQMFRRMTVHAEAVLRDHPNDDAAKAIHSLIAREWNRAEANGYTEAVCRVKDGGG